MSTSPPSTPQPGSTTTPPPATPQPGLSPLPTIPPSPIPTSKYLKLAEKLIVFKDTYFEIPSDPLKTTEMPFKMLLTFLEYDDFKIQSEIINEVKKLLMSYIGQTYNDKTGKTLTVSTSNTDVYNFFTGVFILYNSFISFLNRIDLNNYSLSIFFLKKSLSAPMIVTLGYSLYPQLLAQYPKVAQRFSLINPKEYNRTIDSLQDIIDKGYVLKYPMPLKVAASYPGSSGSLPSPIRPAALPASSPSILPAPSFIKPIQIDPEDLSLTPQEIKALPANNLSIGSLQNPLIQLELNKSEEVKDKAKQELLRLQGKGPKLDIKAIFGETEEENLKFNERTDKFYNDLENYNLFDGERDDLPFRNFITTPDDYPILNKKSYLNKNDDYSLEKQFVKKYPQAKIKPQSNEYKPDFINFIQKQTRDRLKSFMNIDTKKKDFRSIKVEKRNFESIDNPYENGDINDSRYYEQLLFS